MRKLRKQYQTPMHPWNKERIDEERELSRDFGLRNKREIYKMNTILKTFKNTAKRLLARTDAQAEIERGHLMTKLTNLGIIQDGASFDEVLGLGIKTLLARRLQSILVKRRLARSTLQARQFITHRHIIINGQQITSPSYLVPLSEEGSITFMERSSLLDEMHPERPKDEDFEKSPEEKVKEEDKVEEAPSFDEKELKEAEAETT